MAAISIPTIAILAANHWSEQSKEQMRLTGLQNTFSNHFKHIEEFEKYCQRIYDRMLDDSKSTKEHYANFGGALKHLAAENFIYSHIDPQHSRILYKKIYPASASGDLSLSAEFVQSLDLFIREMIVYFRSMESEDVSSRYFSIANISRCISDFSENCYVELRYVGGTKKLTINNVGISIPGGNVMEMVRRLQEVITTLDRALSFDISYIPSALIRHVLRGDFEDLPIWDVDHIPEWKPFDLPKISAELAAHS